MVSSKRSAQEFGKNKLFPLIQPELFGSFHGVSLAKNSICHQFPELQVLLGSERYIAWALSHLLFGDYIEISFIHVYISGSFYYIMLLNDFSNALSISCPSP